MSDARLQEQDDSFEAEDFRAYLGLIQQTVSRMAAASAQAKGWCLTVTLAALGLAITASSWPLAVLALAAVLLFGSLDARYLREERRFRALYERARCRNTSVYDMRTADVADDRCAWSSVLQSWSLWTFYGPLLAVAIGFFIGTVTM